MPDGVWQITRKKRCNFYPCMGWALQRFDIVNIYGEGQNTLNLFDRARSRVQRSSNVYKHINIALKNEFLPVTEPFRTEAAFILQCNANGTLDAWEIKQSIH